MPANNLHLPDFKVQRVEEADHGYHVCAEEADDVLPGQVRS